jgi:hypothetical protein
MPHILIKVGVGLSYINTVWLGGLTAWLYSVIPELKKSVRKSKKKVDRMEEEVETVENLRKEMMGFQLTVDNLNDRVVELETQNIQLLSLVDDTRCRISESGMVELDDESSARNYESKSRGYTQKSKMNTVPHSGVKGGRHQSSSQGNKGVKGGKGSGKQENDYSEYSMEY